MEYRPGRPAYWDETALAEDMKRAFDICNGCRLCYNLCPSFPELFRFVEGHDDDASRLTAAELDRVADLCYQCKLCYVKCPYTPPHHFDLDFPRLMLRSKAVRAKKAGLSRSDRFLGDPDRTGRLGTLLPALTNWATTAPAVRGVMERVVGVDRRRRLPRYARVRFSRWAGARPPARDPDVVVFSTCTVEYNEPGLGRDAVRVLEHQGFTVTVPTGQQCCGMPALDGGDMAGAVARARANVARLADYARAGKPIVALQPTCAYVLKTEYPLLLDDDEAAAAVAAATVDVTDFLADLARSGRLKTDFVRSLGPVTYHVSCHTRALGGGGRGRDLLARVPGTRVMMVEQCAGIDGTWGLKAEWYDTSQEVAAKLTRTFQQRRETEPCSDCKLAGLQIAEAAGRAPAHPVELLARAYGLDDGAATAAGGRGGTDA
ncbi:MAG: ferredoxin [Actinomycetia bacterium]|nr:ferredoxin [Actinomycetes bacterium]